MRILYICQRVPYPPNRGDKIASYNAIRFLAERHEVVVGCVASSEEERGYAEELRQQGFEVVLGSISGLGQKWNALRSLITGEPLSVGFFRSAELKNNLAEAVAGQPVDLVITFSSSMGQYADVAPDVPLIADFVDLDSRKWDLYCQFHSAPRRWIYRLEERRLLEYERYLSSRARCTLLRTEAERRDCLELVPHARVEVLSNGVDFDYFRVEEEQLTSKTGSDMVFTGVMDYFPNVQGVEYFAREVLPLIRERHEAATFTIVGANPTRQVFELGNLPGVTVTGPQPDIRPFIAKARISVAPLHLARGIQNKVLEAMSMSLPVVVSPAVFRGVDVDEGDGVFVAKTTEEYVDRIVGLLDDPEGSLELGRNGRRRVESRYVWSEQLAGLERLAQELVPAPKAEKSGV